MKQETNNEMLGLERVREENNVEIERNACFHFIVVYWLLKSEGYLFSRVISNK
jgi:hypothetical protein